MLAPNDIKEHLALSYVYAVASRAGCSFDVPSVDRDSIDVKLMFRNDHDPEAAVRSPEIGLQVKAHQGSGPPQGPIAFPLKRKNHHDLTKRCASPRLLVVVLLPEDEVDWLRVTEEELILRRCGYWLSLAGCPPTENTTAETVYLPRANIFEPSALRRLMQQVGRQEELA